VSTNRKRPSKRLQKEIKLKLVITAGPTREYFDTIRFISNPSTGRMGYAIAEAAAKAGHRVTLVSGPVEMAAPARVKLIRVETAEEMLRASRRAFAGADAAIFCAAVSDYRPKKRADKKLPKQMMNRRIELAPTPDIAATLGRSKGRRVTIGFAMEDHDGRAHAEKKLQRKHCDAIILNDPGNVGTDRASAEYLVRGGEWQVWPRSTKPQMARRIVQSLQRLWAARMRATKAE